MTRNEVDINNAIRNDYILPTSAFDGRYTKTTLFMLPSLSINFYSRFVKPYFVNAFLDDKGYSHCFTRPIFVLFRTKSLRDAGFYKLYETLRKKEEYILDYEVGLQDGYILVMFVFQCSEKNKENYYHFKAGRYSRFTSEYKRGFSETIVDDNNNFMKSLSYGVINKTAYMKKKVKELFDLDDEVVNEMEEIWGKPTREREYYRYNTDDTPFKVEETEEESSA